MYKSFYYPLVYLLVILRCYFLKYNSKLDISSYKK